MATGVRKEDTALKDKINAASADMTSGLRIAGLSIPKSGTHFLVGVFRELGFKTYPQPKGAGRNLFDGVPASGLDGSYLYGHWRYARETAIRLEENGYRSLVLIRDPRDICLSMADYLKAGRHPDSALASLTEVPLRQLQIMSIRGFEHNTYRTPAIKRICEGWLPWRDHGAALFKYEELCRSARTGTELAQVQQLGVDTGAFLRATQRRMRSRLSPERQYRWQDEFDDELASIWNAHARGVASSLGYDEI